MMAMIPRTVINSTRVNPPLEGTRSGIRFLMAPASQQAMCLTADGSLNCFRINNLGL